MATILQTAPIRDSTAAGISFEYLNQLSMKQASGSLTFTTVTSSPELIITASGQVQTTGSLNPGSYTASGTVVDGVGNTGAWSFTLSVYGPSNELTVTPVQPTLPNLIEVALPFAIDPATGAVAVLTDYSAIMAQHIETICLTDQGERVMMPGYGGNLQASVFDLSNQLVSATLASDIQAQIQQWEPGVNVLGVTVAEGSQPNVVVVTVQFAVNPSTTVSTISVAVGGQTVQVTAS